MHKILQSFMALLLLQTVAYTQNKNDFQWVTGYGTYAIHFGGTKIDFNAGIPSFNHFALPYHFALLMPCSISDEAGKLQFYSNGCQIINFENEVMENGTDLSPGYFQSINCDNSPYGYNSYQNMMILPRPGHPGQYVYFHHTTEMDISSGKILYSEVDMNANNGKGKVIDKNHLLRGPVEQEGAFTAVRHGNGRDWWVIIPEEAVNVYNLYLVTPDTIVGPFAQDWEDNEAAQYVKTGWNVVFSPDGTKFARVTLSNGFNRIFLYDFDRCSGTLSNPQVLRVDDPNVYASWAAISPNSRFLYFQIAQNKLFQYDLQAPDIEASRQLIAEYDGFISPQGFSCAFHAMALGPDNKIYMSCTSGIYYYHTINAPDQPGLACDFRQHDVELPSVNNSLMPLYPNFRLYDLPGSPCDSLGIDAPMVAFWRSEQDTLAGAATIQFTDLSYYQPSSWRWHFSDGTSDTAQSPVHIFPAPGTYTVCLNACNSAGACDTLCRDVEIKTVGTYSPAISGNFPFSISPNPASDYLTIHFQKISSTIDLQLFDTQGHIVLRTALAGDPETTQVDLHNFPAGLYLLRLQTNDGKISTVRVAIVR